MSLPTNTIYPYSEVGNGTVDLLEPRRIFDVVPYSPTEHGAFVRSTWAKGALRDGSSAARARLDAYLSERGSWALVARSKGSGSLVGWAARTQSELIFAYVIVCMRGRHLGWLMLHDLGFGRLTRQIDDDGKTREVFVGDPVPLLHWTPSAQEIAARKCRVFHAVFPIDTQRIERIA